MMTKQKMKILSNLRSQGQNFLVNINLMMKTSRFCPKLAAELRPRLFLKSLILAQKPQLLIPQDIISENITVLFCTKHHNQIKICFLREKIILTNVGGPYFVISEPENRTK